MFLIPGSWLFHVAGRSMHSTYLVSTESSLIALCPLFNYSPAEGKQGLNPNLHNLRRNKHFCALQKKFLACLGRFRLMPLCDHHSALAHALGSLSFHPLKKFISTTYLLLYAVTARFLALRFRLTPCKA